jgi:endonuclease VIII
MPEGPSLILLKEAILHFQRKRVKAAGGNAKIDVKLLEGKTLKQIRTWGKQLFLSFSSGLTVRIHLLMFGSYSVDERTRPKRSTRLELQFANGSVFFYTCSVTMLEPGWEDNYDWHADIMSDQWDPRSARKKLREIPDTMVCDALLDQEIFSGSGNIIKNEVLFRIYLHPESLVGNIPPTVFTAMIRETRKYSFDFLKWKKNNELKKHWQILTKKKCPRCDLPVTKKYCGKTKRRTFFCNNCQQKYE